MKTCDACGYENDTDADFCARCGAHLADVKAKPAVVEKKDEDCYGKEEDECFGLPHGGAICGMLFGLIIIVWALGIIFGWNIWDYFWPLILIIIGSLIVVGAVYTMRRR
ncbi:MAG: zinc ribbon domain-containing protein [Candidatus Odinarchaeota archaeon]